MITTFELVRLINISAIFKLVLEIIYNIIAFNIYFQVITQYVTGFLNTGIRVSNKVEGGSGSFLKTENLSRAIKPPNKTFFP